MKSYLSNLTKAGLGLCLLIIPAVSSASVIAGNFGAGQSYDTVDANIVGNDFSGDNQAQGVSFTPSSSAILGSVSVAVGCFSTGFCPDNVTVSLVANNAGTPGSTTLESFTIAGGTLTGTPSVFTFNSVQDPLLHAATTYWLIMTTDTNDTAVWNWNSTGDMSTTATSLDGGSTWAQAGLTPSAYELNGTNVPEPASVVLVLGSGLLLGFASKLRKS